MEAEKGGQQESCPPQDWTEGSAAAVLNRWCRGRRVECNQWHTSRTASRFSAPPPTPCLAAFANPRTALARCLSSFSCRYPGYSHAPSPRSWRSRSRSACTVADVWRLPLALRSVADLGGVVASLLSRRRSSSRSSQHCCIGGMRVRQRRVGCRAAAGWATREPSRLRRRGPSRCFWAGDRRGCGRRNHRLQSRRLAKAFIVGSVEGGAGLRIHPRYPDTDAVATILFVGVLVAAAVWGLTARRDARGEWAVALGWIVIAAGCQAASPIAHAVHVRANHPQRRRLLVRTPSPSSTAPRASSATLPSFAATGRSTRTATCRAS